MSSRHTRSLFGVLLVMVFALSAIVVAPASAKLTKSQKAHIRHQLRKQVKKNPRVIMKRSFLKKASLVDFVLPTTIRLNPATDQHGGVANSDDAASLDLGPSLGSRTVGLGGAVHANIEFNDAFDGGNLGDVRITLPSDGSRGITSTSVPLLTNPDVTAQPYDDPATPAVEGTGCAGFDGVAHNAGVDSVHAVTASNNPGSVNNVGGGPYSPDSTALATDVVLRTGPLSLGVAAPSGFGANSNSPVGQSGGIANLFGTQPAGKPQVDVKVNLATDINSIEREVDGAYPGPSAGPDPTNGNISALFNCRQAWTGKVANVISTSLTGSLKIAPAITADGHLRIAKVNLSSPDYTNLSLSACLSPYKLFSAGAPLGDVNATDPPFPAPYNLIPPDSRPHTVGDFQSYEGPSLPGGNPAAFDPNLAALPQFVAHPPTVDCDAAGGPLDRAPFNIGPIGGDPLTNGSRVNVLGSIKVTALKGEVLIGSL